MSTLQDESPGVITTSISGINGRSSTTTQSGLSHQVAKRALLVCWFIAVCHIWLASDGSDVFDGSYRDYDNEVDERLRHERHDPPIIAGEDVIERQMDIFEVAGHEDITVAPDDKNGSESVDDNLSKSEDAISEITEIPEALQPITYNDCCVPAIKGKDYKKPQDIACFGTCYNERACTDPSYPYSSMEEREKFGDLRVLTEDERKLMRERCVYKPEYLVPNVTWCPGETGENTNIVKDAKVSKNSSNYDLKAIYGSISHPGCSLVTNGGGSGPWQHVFVFPSAKLAFCGIPKVGITQWIQFSRFIAGAKDYPSLPHYKLDNDFFRFDKLDPTTQQEIWQDEEWTWSVFLRDPAERLLSAYLDKIAKKSEQNKIREILGSVANFTFDDFVGRLAMEYNETGCKKEKSENDLDYFDKMTGLNWCSDPHWRPQILSCGLFERLDRFQFVGDIDNSPDHTRKLLQSVGLWESHGRHFINGGVDKKGKSPLHMCKYKSHPYNHTEHIGFQQNDKKGNATAANTAYGHSKNSESKMREFYTPELMKLVREELYVDDYKLYQLVRKQKNIMMTGRELAVKLSGTIC